jgi:DNA-directed RNA polymerase specialized sigma24 family protein
MDGQSTHSPSSTPVVILVLVLGVVAMLLFRAKRQAAGRERGMGTFREPPSPPVRQALERTPLPSQTEDVTRWEVQMHDLARELTGQIDSKMRLLDQLIRDADRAAARLEAAVSAAQRSKPPTADSVSQADALRAASAAAVFSRDPPASPSPATPNRPDRRYDEIYLLADYGFSQEDIAARTGTPLGEVELILRLRAQRGSGGKEEVRS